MKILVLSYEYPPIGSGGGVICKNISENLALLGNEVTVLTTAFREKSGSQVTSFENPEPRIEDPGSGISNQKFQIKNLTIVRLPSRRKNDFQSNPTEMLSWISTTKKFIKTHPDFVDFDICMAHFVLPGGEVARWLKMKYGLPYVLISHGHEIPWVHPRQMFFYHLATYFWIKKVCVKSALNFIQTQMMKDNIDRFLGMKYHQKNTIIPNGTDTQKFYPDYSKRPDKLRIIFAGRLVLQKAPMTFLKAIRLFSDYTRDFEVHILGDGKMRKKMEQFVIKSGLTNLVRFFGKVSEEKMVEEYQAAHLMVAPSLNEGMSISALEALSCGVYLIATRASGFEEMIGEGVCGDFVGFRQADEIARKLTDFHIKFVERLDSKDNNSFKTGSISDWENISGIYLEALKSRL